MCPWGSLGKEKEGGQHGAIQVDDIGWSLELVHAGCLWPLSASPGAQSRAL